MQGSLTGNPKRPNKPFLTLKSLIMNNDTKPMTAEDFLVKKTLSAYDMNNNVVWQMVIESMKEYARAVAEQVRQQCADKAKIRSGTIFDRVDRESILSVDIEALIK
jgi:hypothetical protein